MSRLVEKEVNRSLGKFIEEYTGEGLDYKEQLDRVYGSEKFKAMSEKMGGYFRDKGEEKVKAGEAIVDLFEQLVTDMKTTREELEKETDCILEDDNLNQEPQTKKGKNEPRTVDVTELLKEMKVRAEIERGYFFHLFYEILRQDYSQDPNERDIFESEEDLVELSMYHSEWHSVT